MPEMKNSPSPNTVLFFAFSFVFIPVFIIEFGVLRHTAGHWIYPLDDTFIHMALAKNLAFHLNWGINPREFASASSSLLYTLLLGFLFRIFQPGMLIPFLVNVAAASTLLLVLNQWMKKEQFNAWTRILVFFCVAFFTPLPVLVISGMEHTLQCLFCFLFIFRFSEWLETKMRIGDRNGRIPGSLYIYGALVCLIRYEGLFIVGILCLVLLYYRRLRSAVLLGIVSVSPLVIWGMISMLKGSFFLPNSVLLKSNSFPISLAGALDFLGNILVQKLTIVRQVTQITEGPRTGITTLATQRLLVILPLAALASIATLKKRPAYGWILLILTACTLLQLAFAATGWLYRYEAYLMLSSVMILSALAVHCGKSILGQPLLGLGKFLLPVLLFFLFFPAILRSMAAFSRTGQACINVYQQQYQMGLFFKKYYFKEPIAANDVGAVSYLTEGNNLDLWGLGNVTVARSRKSGGWTPSFLDSLCRARRVRVAVVYQSWFPEELLGRWKKIADWKIQNNVICGDDKVSYYALDTVDAAALKRHLIEFQPSLPPGVEVSYP
jgi:hypothetical protein